MQAVYNESGLVVEIQGNCTIYGHPFLNKRRMIVGKDEPLRENITEVQISQDVKTLPAGALAGCAIKSLVIPDGVVAIKKDAVRNCLRLESVTISENVIMIEDDAFANCPNLRHVEISENTHVAKHAFRECNENLVIVATAKPNPAVTMDVQKKNIDEQKQDLITKLKEKQNAGVFLDGKSQIRYDRNEWEVARDETGKYLHWIGFRNKRDFYEITIPEGMTNAYRIFDAVPDDFFGDVSIKCSESLISYENIFGDSFKDLSVSQSRLVWSLYNAITKSAILQNYLVQAACDHSVEDLSVVSAMSGSDKKDNYFYVFDDKTDRVLAVCCDKDNVIYKHPSGKKIPLDYFCMKEFMRENGLNVLPIQDVIRALLPDNPLAYTADEYVSLAEANQDYKKLADGLYHLDNVPVLPCIDTVAVEYREESIIEAFREKYPDSGQLKVEEEMEQDGQVYTFVIDLDRSEVVGILDTEQGDVLTYEDLEQKMPEPETGPQKNSGEIEI